VAIITAHGDQSVAVMAHNAGAAAFIEKPFEREDLIERIEQLLLESPPEQLPPGLRG
jgi:FixJ family two-component response regulator